MLIGEELIARGFITQEQLVSALKEQLNSPNEKIGEIMVRMGFITKDQLESCL